MPLTPSEYDDFYKQIDFDSHPFAIRKEYAEWLKTKLNRKIVSYLKNGKVLDAGGGYGYLGKFLSDEQVYYNLEYSRQIQKYDDSENKIIGTGLYLPYKDKNHFVFMA